MRIFTLMFLGAGCFGVLYGTGENVNTGVVYCGCFGLISWSNWNGD
ncbi:hypothetical protein [Viridibacillus arvi]